MSYLPIRTPLPAREPSADCCIKPECNPSTTEDMECGTEFPRPPSGTTSLLGVYYAKEFTCQ